MKRFAIAALCAFAMSAIAQTTPPSVTPQLPPPVSQITLVLSPAEVDIVVKGQTTAYLRSVLIERCAATPCTPVATPPASLPAVPAFTVGNIFSVTSAGVVSGRVVPGSLMVTLAFDGSMVSNVVSTVPAADGTFSVQLPASLHNAVNHEITAYAITATNQKAVFDQKDGNNNTFGFIWK